jgi:hypothetical protein
VPHNKWTGYVKFISFHAQRLGSSTKIPATDFFQSGVLGALEALERVENSFDQHQIKAYVKQHIWHFMLKQIRELQHAVYIPLHLNRKINSGEVSFSSTLDENLENGVISQTKISVSKNGKIENDTEDQCHYRSVVACTLTRLYTEKIINDVELVCFIAHRGLFGYPKLSVEQIGKVVNLSPNTVSKKVLKTTHLFRIEACEYYEKDEVFVK